MCVYLIHFDRPFGHSQHYVGQTDNLEQRLIAHYEGRGAVLIREVSKAGIDWSLVRLWDGGRRLERQLKRNHGSVRYCPVCNPRFWRRNAPRGNITGNHSQVIP